MSDSATPEPTDDDRAGSELVGSTSDRPTGEDQAAENRENEPPA
ncbi:MAG TPA: hypothetical protein VHT75_11045 [Acidimicrobiales bacterium]|jgi:hypothetical protein|nr:hypothetical protein [Acidimicrobiales bacterium]